LTLVHRAEPEYREDFPVLKDRRVDFERRGSYSHDHMPLPGAGLRVWEPEGQAAGAANTTGYEPWVRTKGSLPVVPRAHTRIGEPNTLEMSNLMDERP